jgi:hypothetical protein
MHLSRGKELLFLGICFSLNILIFPLLLYSGISILLVMASLTLESAVLSTFLNSLALCFFYLGLFWSTITGINVSFTQLEFLGRGLVAPIVISTSAWINTMMIIPFDKLVSIHLH